MSRWVFHVITSFVDICQTAMMCSQDMTMICTVLICLVSASVYAEKQYDCPKPFSDRKHVGYQCGDNMCLCIANQACCLNQGNKLDYIPTFNTSIQKISFIGNYLPYITESTFNNVSDLNLTFLDLINNSLTSCGPNAFHNLKFLQNVHIRNENIIAAHLKICILSIRSTFLTALSFVALNLDRFPSTFFSGMEYSPVVNFNMDGTYIGIYNQSTYSVFQHLRELHLAGCKINETYLEHSDRIHTLVLGTNKLISFPKFCVNGQSVFPNLESLTLTNNFIQSITPSDLHCLQSLKHLEMSTNPLQTIYSNMFSGLTNIHIIGIDYVTQMFDPPVVQQYAFNSSSLREIYFGNNRFQFDGKQVDLKVFQNCKNLETLYVQTNNMEFTTDEMFDELFCDLTNLKKLSLSNTRLHFLPSVIPRCMKKLETLYLDHNYITVWPDGYFYSLRSLTIIDLKANHISSINSSSFSKDNWEKITSISLNKNTFSCTCQLLWFINFLGITDNSRKFRFYPKEYLCSTPPTLETKQIAQTYLSTRYCIVTRQVSNLIISFSSTVFLLVMLASAVYRYRWHLRYMMYMVRFHHRRYQTLLHRENYKYDIYLSCSDDDCDFVLDHIAKKLEEEMGLRVYIPHRDGIGNKIDAIISSLDDSRKVILCLSNSYAKDQYCEFEARLAYDRCLNERRDLMLVVLLQELNTKNLTKVLYKIIKVNDYILWNVQEDDIQLFWLKLIKFLNNLNDLRP